jgi:hypothetical protein
MKEETLVILEDAVKNNQGLKQAIESLGLPVNQVMIDLKKNHRERFRIAFEKKKNGN